MRQFRILMLSMLVLIFIACDKTDGPVLPEPPFPPGFDSYQDALLNFSYATFQNVLLEDEENVLISPLSLESALCMTMEGTAGVTHNEFITALRMHKFEPTTVKEYNQELRSKLVPNNEATQMGNHNAIFHSPSVSLYDEFQNSMTNFYQAEIESLDFTNGGTVDKINDWVADKTEDRIKEVINEIKPDEVLFLINALFFKSDWNEGFEPGATTERPFTKSNGEQIMVDVMSSDTERDHYIGDDYSAVDLKFTDGEYSMTFIRPETTDLNAFVLGSAETDFMTLVLDLYANKLENGRVQTLLPKFEIAKKKNMVEILKMMGMTTTFEMADLSEMGTFPGNTYLSRVLHDTYLKIDEKGAEGAAVTTVGVGVESVPPTVNFDVPFLFVLRHVETNTPVFVGKCGNPNE